MVIRGDTLRDIAGDTPRPRQETRGETDRGRAPGRIRGHATVTGVVNIAGKTRDHTYQARSAAIMRDPGAITEVKEKNQPAISQNHPCSAVISPDQR